MFQTLSLNFNRLTHFFLVLIGFTIFYLSSYSIFWCGVLSKCLIIFVFRFKQVSISVCLYLQIYRHQLLLWRYSAMPWRLHSQLSTLEVDNEVPVPSSHPLCGDRQLSCTHRSWFEYPLLSIKSRVAPRDSRRESAFQYSNSQTPTV